MSQDFEVRNPHVEFLIRDIGRTIKSIMPEGYGFALLMFTYEPGALFYVSSGNREDMIKQFEEAIQKLRS